jgi:superoxide dismutase
MICFLLCFPKLISFSSSFFLQYKNVKPDYVKAIWDVINWDTVEARLQAAK